jgi:predicted NAD-dependent protein-ADP-ribosyltransferase YbiA (DUF1768 family)
MDERVIKYWRGDEWFLDNSYETPIVWQGLSYPTVTHAFLAAQEDNLDLKLKIAHSTLGELENLAEEVREPTIGFRGPDTMRALLEQKFGYSNRDKEMTVFQIRLAQRLLSTGHRKLVYGNHVCNMFWGDCDCSIHYDMRGTNVLGGLIEGVREKLVDLVTRGVNRNQTCGCENNNDAFFLYGINGKLWLKPFCLECQGKAGVMLAQASQDRGIYRFEKSWFPERKEVGAPVNKIKVPSNIPTIRPDVFRQSSGEAHWGMWTHYRREPVEQVPDQNLPKNKVFYLSGRIN